MKSTIFECKAHSNKTDIFFLEFLADISKENLNKKKLHVKSALDEKKQYIQRKFS